MKKLLKNMVLFIFGVIFYPFISSFIILDSIGFFNKIKELNWVVIITYICLGFFSCLWIKYVMLPLLFLLSGNIID